MDSVLSSFTQFFISGTLHVHGLTLPVNGTYTCVMTFLEVLHLNTIINLISNFVYLSLLSCTSLMSILHGIYISS